MKEAGCGACAMEVSSHALDQHRATGIAYKVAVFTNLGHDHLDYHGTMERYAAAKAALFSLVSKDGCAIVNGQDAWAARMVRDAVCPIVRCGVVREREGAHAFDLAAVLTGRGDLVGTEIEIVHHDRVVPVRVPLIGEHNVMNALEALASVMQLGVSLDEGVELLAQVHCPPGRMERVEASLPAARGAELPAVYVDYAHTPESLEAVLGLARDVVRGSNRSQRGARAGRVVCVFGCGGDRDRAKRPRMGEIAQRLCAGGDDLAAGVVVITSDNPRTEEPDVIAAEIAAGLKPRGEESPQITVELDRAAAIARAVGESTAGDLVLIAGKGHEDYQIVRDDTIGPDGKPATVKRAFDDRIEARRALDAKLRDAAIHPLRVS
jgi:UDP-N-acetylmuramoyl-L-alanyl-D-glutamate--2,6-diaminopimelate ligase